MCVSPHEPSAIDPAIWSKIDPYYRHLIYSRPPFIALATKPVSIPVAFLILFLSSLGLT